jgi:glycosyltransferase involved in cell wall biosynthesis
MPELPAEQRVVRGDGRRTLLALSVYPEVFAATRFRVAAYRDVLARAGIDLELSPFLDPGTIREIQGSRPSLRAIARLVSALQARVGLLLARKRYAAVLVQREAMMVGPPWLELAFAKLGLPLIYDIDDALWLTPPPAPGSLRARFPRIGDLVRAPRKGESLLTVATSVICGSDHLSEFVRGLNRNVTTIPTVTDLRTWQPLPCRHAGSLAADIPVIGWIGTPSTGPALAMVEPALLRLREEGYSFKVRIRGASSPSPLRTIQHESLPWRAEHEVADFAEIDIGLAPMEQSEWSAGKCAFKQIQYMAVGVPFVSSLAGAASELLVHDENSLIAHSTEDWYTMLKTLLDSAGTRARLSAGGLRTAVTKYSLQAQEARFLGVIERAMEPSQTPTC